MAGKLSKMQLITVQLVGWWGWLSGIALAQLEFSEAVMGSANITDVGITCLSNAAVFVTSFLRRRLYLEMGARDVMATIIGPPKLKEIRDVNGLITEDDESASVVMLSSDLSNPSMRLLMQYMYNTHDVYSIVVKYDALRDRSPNFVDCNHGCKCIVFGTNDEIRKKLVARIPETLKVHDEPYCLLPCKQCRARGCHDCNRDLLSLNNSGQFTMCNPREVEPSAVREALDIEFDTDNNKEPICICIPLSPTPEGDEWTKALVKSFKSKDVEDRGAIVTAPIILENYLSMKGENRMAQVYYKTTTFIVPRLVEILINLAVTGWLKVDGFSSAMVARKAVRSHIVDSTGNGFAANAFLTAVQVNSVVNSNGTTVCQKLRFRSSKLLTLKTLSALVGFVNLICSVGWALSIARRGHAPKWYRIPSSPPSKPRLAVALAAIGIGLVMDCFDFCSSEIGASKRCKLAVLMFLEMVYIVTGIAVARTLGIKGTGRWVYSALQILVWVKWGVGCYLLREYSPEYVQPPSVIYSYQTNRWVDVGTMVYSSSFLLNAFLAGVRGWK